MLSAFIQQSPYTLNTRAFYAHAHELRWIGASPANRGCTVVPTQRNFGGISEQIGLSTIATLNKPMQTQKR